MKIQKNKYHCIRFGYGDASVVRIVHENTDVMIDQIAESLLDQIELVEIRVAGQ